jgi:hypothetical protein
VIELHWRVYLISVPLLNGIPKKAFILSGTAGYRIARLLMGISM